MVKKRQLWPLPILDGPALQKFLEQRHVKLTHAATITKEVVRSRPEKLQDLIFQGNEKVPEGLIDEIAQEFVIFTSNVVETYVSSDGTTKLLVELQDGQRVEAVIIKHEGRNTLCVSSQIGCQMGCTFCATGTMGIKGDLWAGEIVEQLYHANGVAPIRNLVFMGMGEPLMNYDAVMAAIKTMTDMKGFGLSFRQVTVSTVGVIPRIRQMTAEAPHVTLALSLHAPNQDLRAKIVPSARAYPLGKLMEATRAHVEKTNRQLFAEYILLKGVNDRPEHAWELCELLRGMKIIVNLIPYNATDVVMDFETPDDEDVDRFHHIVAEAGFLCTVRRHHGREIGGACGQLALKKPSTTEGGAAAVADIEDLGQGGGRAVGDSKKPQPMVGGVRRRRREEVDGALRSASDVVTAYDAGRDEEPIVKQNVFIGHWRRVLFISMTSAALTLVLCLFIKLGISVYSHGVQSRI